MKLLQICYKVRRNIVEGVYKICRSQNITRHLLAELPCVPKPADSHPQSSLQSVWDVGRVTRADIRSQALHLRLLAPANSAHLRSL